MRLGCVERCTIAQDERGVTISMRQGGRAVGLIAVTLGMIGVVWRWGPFGSHASSGLPPAAAWMGYGFLGLFLLFGVLGACYREEWLITSDTVIERTSFDRTGKRITRGSTLALRVRQQPGRGKDHPFFPYEVVFLDNAHNDTSLALEFQLDTSVDACLKLLRLALPVDVEGWPPTHGSL